MPFLDGLLGSALFLSGSGALPVNNLCSIRLKFGFRI
jgi:hypothetical protein